MSEHENNEIMHRLNAQDKAIQDIIEQNKRQFQMLEPMYKIFTGVSSFGDISVWILKGLILVGAGMGVIYAFIKWLKS